MAAERVRESLRLWLWTALLVLYVCFIFSNSLTPGDESSARSGLVLELARRFLAAVGLGHVGITEHFIRKLAHFGEYLVLGMLIQHVVRGFFLEAARWIPLWLLTGILVPLCDETCQLFTLGRSGQISDVWLDISGMLSGSLLYMGIRAAVKNHRRRKEGDGNGRLKKGTETANKEGDRSGK